MRLLFTALACLISVSVSKPMFCQSVTVQVEEVDNGSIVPGRTYRVFAVLSSAQHSLHAVFSVEEHVLNFATTRNFFQHLYGSSSSLDVNEAIVGIEPGLAFDSWVTVGAESSENNNLFTIGVDYSDFLAGNELNITDGAWFVVPTDVQAAAEVGNKVLLMQLTTEGKVDGLINLHGRTKAVYENEIQVGGGDQIKEEGLRFIAE